MKQTAIFLCTLLLFSIPSYSQNTSYSANTVPVGGNYSTAFGPLALHVNTGSFNTATGYASMYINTSGSYNVATGGYALYSNVTGTGNTAMGHFSLFSTTGTGNTAMGYYSLLYNSTGNYNTASGSNVLYYNTGGQYNTASGYQALYHNTTGSYNAAIGYSALFSNTTGSYNIGIGLSAVANNTSGNENIGVGYQALSNNTTGSYNMGIGTHALGYNQAGTENTAIGHNAFSTVVGGSYNTCVGAESSIGEFNNTTCIGYGTVGVASNQVRLGNNAITTIGGQVGWTIYSDARVKSNLTEDVPGFSFISLLKPVTYNYNIAKENELLGIKNDTMQWPGKNNIEKMKFSGFVAQEVDAAAHKVGYDFSGVDKNGPIMGLRYADFVVPLVKTVQEQQQQIDELKKIIAANPVTGSTMELSDKNAVALNQNMPNPFTKQTVISFSIPLSASSAQLVFYDASGRLISSHTITDRGRSLVTIAANDLSSGVYSYTLVIDGKIEGSKQLIKQ